MAAARPAKRAIAEQLRADGIELIFGNPGTVEQGLLDELGTDGFRYVLGLQEAAVVGMADGYARATHRPALVQLHSGVGLGNAIGMLYQAMRGHSPLVVVAGEAGMCYEALEAQMAADLVGMARPVTKLATRVVHPGSVLRVLRRAVKTALTPPRGPVFVALPMDVLDEVTTEPVVPTAVPQTRVQPTRDLVSRMAALLSAASRPVILAGDGVVESGAHAELTRVAEILGAEVWLADTSETTMDSTHPLFRGGLGHMFGSASTAALHGADAALVVGTYLFPEVFPSLDSPFEPPARVVHVDLDPAAIGKNHPADLGLVADPKLTLTALADRLAEMVSTGDRQEAAGRVHQAARVRAARPEPTDRADALDAVLRELARRAPDDLVVFDEALTVSPRVTRHLPPRRPGDYFVTRGGSLGVGIPGAVGVKLARPGSTVVAFVGDGASMYTIPALWTAARHRLDVRIVICNNGRYELLAQNIDEYWAERGIAAHPYPDSFSLSPEIGFCEVARGLGATASRVEKPEDAEAAVDLLLDASGPSLLDVLVDPDSGRTRS